MAITRLSQPQRVRFLSTSILLFLILFFGNSLPLSAAEPIPDSEITLSVEAQLARDPMVPANLIHVETNQGVVTLTGSVDNVFAKELATKLAETVRGVQSVINRITVTPLERSDEHILNDVKQAFRLDPATNPSKASVEVKDGVVTLTGTVDSWAEKQIYTEDAAGVEGVRGIQNQMNVKEVAARPGDEIQKEVERRLRLDVWLNADLIDVKVKDGRVALTGIVGSAAQKSRAYDDAWVAGVKSVAVGGLSVDPSQYKPMLRQQSTTVMSNDEVVDAVRNAFSHDPRVSSFTPMVTVQDGVVTLKGAVSNLKAKHAMEQDALNTLGVLGVKNDIEVVLPTRPSDKAIAQSIRDELSLDSFLKRQKIDVTVTSGEAKLSGQVQYPFEKSRAEDLASQIIGVKKVVNTITVGTKQTTQ